MSSVGKILVVVNLVLSLLVVGSLSALLQASKATADDNAKLQKQLADSAAAAQAQLDEAASELRAVQHDKQQLEAANQDIEVRAGNAEAQVLRTRADVEQFQTELKKLAANYDLQQSDLSAKDQRIADLQDSNDSLRNQADDAGAARLAAENARRDADDRVVALERQIAQKDDELAMALARAHKSELLVDVAKQAGFNPASMLGMPTIEGLVASVDDEYDFVIIDKGSNDGVEAGFTFDIYRPGANGGYLGQVQADDVHADYCTAKIKILAPDRSIKRSDMATTRL